MKCFSEGSKSSNEWHAGINPSRETSRQVNAAGSFIVCMLEIDLDRLLHVQRQCQRWQTFTNLNWSPPNANNCPFRYRFADAVAYRKWWWARRLVEAQIGGYSIGK